MLIIRCLGVKEKTSFFINNLFNISKLKHIIFILLIFHFLSSYLNAQDDFKVVKIDNSDYPYIELYVRTNKSTDPKEFSVYENNKKVDFISDTILLKDYRKERSILFVTEENPDEDIKTALIKAIRTFTETDKMNLAVILDEDTSNNVIHYVSPEFTNNHSFFINALEQKILDDIYYDVNRKNIKTTESIEQNMFSKQEAFSNKGIIFLMNDLKLKPEPCSNILKGPTIPVYVLLTKDIRESSQNELINICTETGGIFTISNQNEIEKYMNLYLEDIALQINETKSELYSIIFETGQTRDKNFFKIRYKDQSRQYIFTKPQKYLLSLRERILIILSASLFFILLLIVLRKKRKRKNYVSSINGIKEKVIITKEPPKPIEINVKTKGFNKTYFLEKHIIRIGRSSDNDIIIPDRTVSGSHAVINKEGDEYMIQDIGSTNGVLLNQKKIKKHKLRSKDKIKLGGAILVVRI